MSHGVRGEHCMLGMDENVCNTLLPYSMFCQKTLIGRLSSLPSSAAPSRCLAFRVDHGQGMSNKLDAFCSKSSKL